MRLCVVPFVVGMGLLFGAVRARADQNDLSLSRFVAPPALQGGNVPVGGARPDDVAMSKFRSLSSELGVLISPKMLSPSDTMGFSGFQFSVEAAFTEISRNADFWDAAQRVNPANPMADRPPGYVSTVGFFVRKGIWLPFPSFEFGVGALHLEDSSMWGMQGYAKFALQEGFHDWPLPSLAVRGSASRLIGSQDIDLTVAAFDVSISKSFAIGGTVSLHPYAGWSYLWIIPRSAVLDATPWCDAYRPAPSNNPMFPCPSGNNITDINSNFAFPEQSNITRHRLFVGAKLRFYILALLAEWEYTFAGDSEDKNHPNVFDNSGDQQTIAISGMLDF